MLSGGVPYRIAGTVDTYVDPAAFARAVSDALSPAGVARETAVLRARCVDVRARVATLTTTKNLLDARAERLPTVATWATFAFLSLQFGVLFNWVFFVFDWNLVEPVTYFLGYTPIWLGILFYCSYGKAFTYDACRDVLRERSRRRLYARASFDAAAFQALCAEAAVLEGALARLE